MTDFIIVLGSTLMALVLAMLLFEIAYKLGRRAALDDVVSAFNKLPLRKDVREAIDDGMRSV